VREWLEPDRTAKEMLMRLEGEHPGRFNEGQLRTLQRRVKEWRRSAVQRLVFPGPDLQGCREEATASTQSASESSMLPKRREPG
jgi:hypothetical protein